jgi:accessory gene regulator protein AgrB
VSDSCHIDLAIAIAGVIVILLVIIGTNFNHFKNGVFGGHIKAYVVCPISVLNVVVNPYRDSQILPITGGVHQPLLGGKRSINNIYQHLL